MRPLNGTAVRVKFTPSTDGYKLLFQAAAGPEMVAVATMAIVRRECLQDSILDFMVGSFMAKRPDPFGLFVHLLYESNSSQNSNTDKRELP